MLGGPSETSVTRTTCTRDRPRGVVATEGCVRVESTDRKDYESGRSKTVSYYERKGETISEGYDIQTFKISSYTKDYLICKYVISF